MIRYFMIACALKLFSLSVQTKKLYRFLGNTLGARKRARAGLPKSYIDRAKWILSVFERHKIEHEGIRLLELGTGWVHWESTILRLFYNAQFTLFDVWDNRQLGAFKTYVSELHDLLGREIGVLGLRHGEVRDLLEAIAAVNSFAELYHLLGFEYIVEPTGTLRTLEQGIYDACFSVNVLEHVNRTIAPEYVKDLYSLLKPGGYSFQVIDISDHLANYDRSVCRKNYLKYSDAVWRLCFENSVQYFNRIQRGEWLCLFRQAGFELLEEESLFQPVRVTINKDYKGLDRKDIECVVLKMVHRKPQFG